MPGNCFILTVTKYIKHFELIIFFVLLSIYIYNKFFQLCIFKIYITKSFQACRKVVKQHQKEHLYIFQPDSPIVNIVLHLLFNRYSISRNIFILYYSTFVVLSAGKRVDCNLLDFKSYFLWKLQSNVYEPVLVRIWWLLPCDLPAQPL